MLGYDPGSAPARAARAGRHRAAEQRHLQPDRVARGARALRRLLPAPARRRRGDRARRPDREGATRARARSRAGSAGAWTSRSALVGDPELIFLDEPTTGFDPAARRTAWETIRSLRDLGKTVLLTTHYLDEAQELADRVAIIKDGRILAEGSPASSASARGSPLPGRLPGATASSSSHQTDDPTTLLHELTGAALARGERLEGLTVDAADASRTSTWS